MTESTENPERPVAALCRAYTLLEAAGTVPLRATDAVALLTYQARLASTQDNPPGEAGSPELFDLRPQLLNRSACEPGSEAAAMLRLLSFGHALR